MLAFLNFGAQELVLIAAIAVVIFGKRLPEVAAQAYAQLARARHALENLRRETGIDRELRNIEHEVRDAARKSNLTNPLLPPSGLRSAWDAAQKVDEDEAPPSGDGDSATNEEPAGTEDGGEPPVDDRLDRRESG